MRTAAFIRWSVAALACLVTAAVSAVPGTGAGRATWLPARLSETGLYSDPARFIVDRDHRAYSPQYPLWTDGADKRRWVRLPAEPIDASNLDRWEFPVGTRFWKEFAFGGRRVETRMLTKLPAGDWQFATYVWTADQADALLAPEGGVPDAVEIAPGKGHSIPAIEDCRACHDSGRTEVLGFSALQLSDDRDPLAVHAEPLRTGDLSLSTLVNEARLWPERMSLVSEPPRIPAGTARERAVLGYLSTNCGACHNRASTLAPLGLDFRQPAYGGGRAIVNGGLARRTKWDRPGIPPEQTLVVDPNAPDLSALLVRMRSRRPSSQMPPMGTVVADHEGLALVGGWLREEVVGAAVAASHR